ncbi:ComF family protein [Serratia sp. JSRIV006]|uniref:ComF family protein n=1 Tax=Serratia sp. JSRIV006 TaxID=2831896 RepID=UPI001CBEFCC9|nr:ComF family protein [Serratia sp. JSRIV006]UAN62512.1 ComF family protein [Serratia sp. JSRIV006]
MEVNIKDIAGNWNRGVVLDKHSKFSVVTGQNEWGHNIYDTTRTEVGEALFLLKYRSDWSQVQPLAQCLYDEAYPLFENVGFILPMAASNVRARQPVTEIAQALANLAGVPCIDNLLLKAPGGVSLKNLHTKEEKVEAIGNSFSVNPIITNQGCWNVLVIDDLYHTGASMEAACAALRGYNKINNIYVATLTWR